MTRGEVEPIARGMRTRCLHFSWSELVGFWEKVIGDLKDAYQDAVHSVASFGRISSIDSTEMQKRMRDKLAGALSLLASEPQVAKWEAEASKISSKEKA